MKKFTRQFLFTALSMLLAASLCFAAVGCGEDQTTPSSKTESEIAGFNLPYSAGQATDDFYDYDSDLFYLNETRLNGADPGAIYASVEDVTDSYEKLKRSWQYKDADGAFQWQEGKTEEQFVAQYGTLEYWLEEYSDWYYMIVTGDAGGGAYPMWRSHDLTDWVPCGQAKGNTAISYGGDDWCINTFWAPEFIRDPASGLYFIFFSANTKNGNAKTTYGPNGTTTGYSFDGLTVSCAVSVNPLGPYRIVTAKDYYEIRAQKNADGTLKTGETAVDMADLDMDGEPDEKAYEIYDYDNKVIAYYKAGNYYNLNGHTITNANPVVSTGYYYMRLATDERKVNEMIEKFSVRNLGLDYDCCVWPAIDVNPVISADGTMMLYFSQHISTFNKGNNVWCVKMKDWLSPDWDTLTHISTPGYVQIYQDGSFEGQWEYQLDENGDFVYYEGVKVPNTTYWNEGSVNEGTEVLEHNGKWYFTYSPFGYGSREYAPYVAVADEPTGPFVKLGTKYSPIIGIGSEPNDYMSGTGHHVFIKAGDELWILYHCFWNPVNNSDPTNDNAFLGRCIGADRAYWKYTPELGYDMLYGNGPTYNLQPKPETYTGYTNVAKYAAIEGNGDFGEIGSLTDGLVTSQPFSRQWEYGSEKGELQIKLKWETPVEITSFHIYNSGNYYKAFKKVSAVKFKLASAPAWYQGEKTSYCYIKDLPTFAADYQDDNKIVRKGAAAMAQFDKITVTEMTITIKAQLDNDNKYSYFNDLTFEEDDCGIRIAELYIMGKQVNN